MTAPDRTPQAALDALLAGNARFVRGERRPLDLSPQRRASLADAQSPHTVLFGCADSRVAAEIVFDADLGELFVVRTAGHVVDTSVLGSIEYGVAVLGANAVVVLGHDRCGAVAATVQAIESGAVPGGFIRDVIERVTPSVLSARRDGPAEVTAVEAEHVRKTVSLLVDRSAVLAAAVADGRCVVLGLVYALSGDGRVREVARVGRGHGSSAGTAAE